MSKLLRDLSGAAERADQSIQDLRRSASEGGRKLQKKMDQARSLIDELQFITAAAGNVADRLEKMTDAGGKKIRGEETSQAPSQKPAEPETDLPSGAEAEVTGNERPFNQMGDTSTDSGEVEGDERRSRAEEELLRAIRERRGKS
jgi:hypothetical protein